jgi:hypothetical protein
MQPPWELFQNFELVHDTPGDLCVDYCASECVFVRVCVSVCECVSVCVSVSVCMRERVRAIACNSSCVGRVSI